MIKLIRIKIIILFGIGGALFLDAKGIGSHLSIINLFFLFIIGLFYFYLIKFISNSSSSDILDFIVKIFPLGRWLLVGFCIKLLIFSAWNEMTIGPFLKEKDYTSLKMIVENSLWSSRRFRTLEALSMIKEEKGVINIFISIMTDINHKDRKTALLFGAKIGDNRMIEPLILALKEENVSIQKIVAEGIENLLKKLKSYEPLFVVLKNNSELRLMMIEFLMKHNDKNILRISADTIGKIKDPLAVIPLVTFIKNEKMDYGSESNEVRKAAVKALERIGAPSCVEALINTLNNKNISDVTRCLVAEALGNIGDIRATESLINTIKDRDISLRRAVKYELVKIKPSGIIIKTCTQCEGKGEKKECGDCLTCGGNGKLILKARAKPFLAGQIVQCYACLGSGRKCELRWCDNCDGIGYTILTKTLSSVVSQK